MATPHLCSESATKTTDRRIICSPSHLLIIRRATAWSNKELVVTPKEEAFCHAVTFSDASSYGSGTGSDVVSDGNAMANNYRAVWATRQLANWFSGHRPLFNYYTRGWGPWAIRTINLDTSRGPRIYEAGGSRLLLKFGFKAFPAGTFTSCKIYLRLWNPSFMYTTPTEFGGTSIIYSYAPNFAYGNSADCCFHFDNEPCPPSQFQADGYGSFALPTYANEGKGASTGDGTLQFANLYDMWGTHLTNAASSTGWRYQRTAIYIRGKTNTGGTRDNSQYYYDYELTGTARERLVQCIKKGDVYMTVGFNIGNALSDSPSRGVHAQSTVTSYISRFEIVIRATGNKLNY